MNSVETRPLITLSRKASGVAFILLDCPGKLNSLGTPVLKELQEAFAGIGRDQSIKAVVLMSGKPDTFVIGADLFEIRKASGAADLYKLAKGGQDLFNTIAAFSRPVVIAINGACLGGGLEGALAAHWRIATDEPITQLGLPETRLGLIPGLGGTQRLPRLVGLKAALSMILSAETISAKEALSLGLIDEIVPKEVLMSSAEQRALELSAGCQKVTNRQKFMVESETCDWPLPDLDKEKANKLFAMTQRSLRIKTRGNYPAQTRVLDVMQSGLEKGIKEGLELEAQTFSELACSETSANLIALFFQTDFARQSAASLAAKFGEQSTKIIGVVGGGMMGSSIANLSLAHDLDVIVNVKPGREQAVLDKIRLAERVQCLSSPEPLAKAQLVLEALPEDLGLKQSVLQQVESVIGDDCVLASNTSSLSLSELSGVLKRPDRFVGVHFFHPVDKMPLVEIVSSKTTSRKAVARAADYVIKLGKIPLMVKDGPGFLLNRLLTCYLLESARIAEEGIPLNYLEEAAVEFGMPMGPYEVLDEVGWDLVFKVSDTLHKAFGERMAPPAILAKLPALGFVGKKTGTGIYVYDDAGRRKDFNPSMSRLKEVVITQERSDSGTRKQLAHRLIFPMIDEAARCLEDRIVMKPREIDMAVVYGTGFPAFRGGILKYADHIGLKHVAATLEQLYAAAGGARQVSPLIGKYISEARGFYSRGGKDEE